MVFGSQLQICNMCVYALIHVRNGLLAWKAPICEHAENGLCNLEGILESIKASWHNAMFWAVPWPGQPNAAREWWARLLP